MRDMSQFSWVKHGIEVIQTGSLKLDNVLCTGGIPKGTICEITGTTGSGKTSLCLGIIRSAQENTDRCIFIDADHMLDIQYAKKFGVDLDHLVVIEPLEITETLDMIHTLCHSGAALVIIVDSITNIAWDPGDSAIDFQEKMIRDQKISTYLQNLSPIIRQKGIILVFTQVESYRRGKTYFRLRENTARIALKLHAGLRIDLGDVEHLKIDNNIIGQRSRVRILKNKYSPYKDQTELDIIYGVGIHRSGEIIDLGDRFRIINRQGADYVFENYKFGPGRENAVKFLEHNPKIRTEIEQLIRHRIAFPELNNIG